MNQQARRVQKVEAQRTDVSFTSIGVEVEEPLFLDETEAHGPSRPTTDGPSPFDLFADENDPPPAAPRPTPPVSSSELSTNRATTSGSSTLNLVALFVLVAATTMFVTVQACQVNRGAGTAGVAQPGR